MGPPVDLWICVFVEDVDLWICGFVDMGMYLKIIPEVGVRLAQG